MTPLARENIKHRPTPGQINIKPHTNGLFTTSVPITLYIKSGFQQKRIIRNAKNKQKQSQETKQASEPNSDMTQVLEWSYI